jgi:hypothetical protein
MPRNIHLPGGLIESHRIITRRLKGQAIQVVEHADIKDDNVEQHDSVSNSKIMSHSSQEVRDRRLEQRLCQHIAHAGTQGLCVSVCVNRAVRQGERHTIIDTTKHTHRSSVNALFTYQ